VTMIEKVAQAIALSMEHGFPERTRQTWDEMSVPAKNAHRWRAKAAIEAMLDPTDAMKEAGANRLYDQDDMAVWLSEAAYFAMIERALEE